MKTQQAKMWPRIWQRLKLMLILIAVGLAVSTLMVPAAAEEDHIYALRNGNEVQFVSRSTDLDFEENGFYIHPLQGDEPQVVLQKGQEVTLHTHDKTLYVVSRLETVSNLLHRLGITVDPDDMIIFDLIADKPDITLSHEVRLLRDVEVPTSFDSEHVSNPMMYKGEERVKQEGVAGTIIETYEDIYYMGALSGSELVNRTNDTAVTEIIEYGTRVSWADSGDTIESVHPGEDGSGGYLQMASGDTMSYSYVTTCSATAYSGGWGTASGMPLGAGTVAVDPSVFPYGTRFFIQTSSGSWVYGMGEARDCGGSIKGHKIDLWFSSYDTACQWGLRDCTVYVLN